MELDFGRCVIFFPLSVRLVLLRLAFGVLDSWYREYGAGAVAGFWPDKVGGGKVSVCFEPYLSTLLSPLPH